MLGVSDTWRHLETAIMAHPACDDDVQAICETSSQPVVVQQIDSGNAQFSIRQQEFTALAPAYLGNIPVSVQQVGSCSG